MNLSLKSGYVLRKGLKAFNQKDQFVITFKFILFVKGEARERKGKGEDCRGVTKQRNKVASNKMKYTSRDWVMYLLDNLRQANMRKFAIGQSSDKANRTMLTSEGLWWHSHLKER